MPRLPAPHRSGGYTKRENYDALDAMPAANKGKRITIFINGDIIRHGVQVTLPKYMKKWELLMRDIGQACHLPVSNLFVSALGLHPLPAGCWPGSASCAPSLPPRSLRQCRAEITGSSAAGLLAGCGKELRGASHYPSTCAVLPKYRPSTTLPPPKYCAGTTLVLRPSGLTGNLLWCGGAPQQVHVVGEEAQQHQADRARPDLRLRGGRWTLGQTEICI